jgi:hypothetical protein
LRPVTARLPGAPVETVDRQNRFLDIKLSAGECTNARLKFWAVRAL